MRVLTVFGTRPEAIKLAPIIKELEKSDHLDSFTMVTGQHREMLDQALKAFEIEPDLDLNLMRPNQTLSDVSSSLLTEIGKSITDIKPDYVIVQGDTTSAFVGSLASFYQKIPVAHVEAGLRSFDNFRPFPEEVNRRLISVLARVHFAPTKRAEENLLREGISSENIFLTGNTIVDALYSILEKSDRVESRDIPEVKGKRFVLVTAHRRENWGKPLENICQSINIMTKDHPDIEVIFPVHLNPVVREKVEATIEDKERIHLIKPCDYVNFVCLMDRCSLILTDSGGIQEEAVSLNKKVLVMRDVTERQEAVEVGTASLVGTDPVKIATAASQYLVDGYSEIDKNYINPYGDGRAAEKIVNILTDISQEDLKSIKEIGDGSENNSLMV